MAMTKPNNPEFPCLGVFKCMAKLIKKGLKNKVWLLNHQNIYIPYYAAHIIGSYTMNKPQFAEKVVKSNVVAPLIELVQSKISWVEQRVSLRALGRLARHEATFEAVAEHKEEIIEAPFILLPLACTRYMINLLAWRNLRDWSIIGIY